MTVREMMAVLATADPDATLSGIDEEGVTFDVDAAAVFSDDEVQYTGLPRPAGTVVLTLGEIDEEGDRR